MAFHGGLIGTTLAIVIFAIRRNIPVMSLIDLASAPMPIGLFFGRIANFVNGELYGRPFGCPWAMVFLPAVPRRVIPASSKEAALEGLLLCRPAAPDSPLRAAFAIRPDRWCLPGGLRAMPDLRRVLSRTRSGA
jgi:prolipoprotein diacylglyceryltransferase